jgi:hypothetical protein
MDATTSAVRDRGYSGRARKWATPCYAFLSIGFYKEKSDRISLSQAIPQVTPRLWASKCEAIVWSPVLGRNGAGRRGARIVDGRLAMAEGRTLMADHSPLTTMHCPLPFEDFRRRLIYDGRGSIGEVPPWWRLPHVLFKVRNGALTPRDVRNEGRSGYVHENTGEGTKCTPKKRPFYTKMHPLHDN